MKAEAKKVFFTTASKFNKLVEDNYKRYFDFREDQETFERARVYRISTTKMTPYEQQLFTEFKADPDSSSGDTSSAIVQAILKDLITQGKFEKGIFVIEEEGD